MRLLGWRNRILGSKAFQRHAAANPLLRPIARRRAGDLFDLVAGFAYTQVLLAMVESGCLQRLAQGPADTAELAEAAKLSREAALRLMRAAAAIGIAQEAAPGLWMLGRHGAALHGNAGALAMIRHHSLLYADLADPLELLRQDRAKPTALSRYWSYVGQDDGAQVRDTQGYSQLMADSQAAVSQEVIAAFPFSRHRALLDIGGGQGAFLRAVGDAHPKLRLGLFDLPDVVDRAPVGGVSPITGHKGSFFNDPVPQGYDLVSLVRILHDHDDELAMQLLRNIRASLTPGARLLVAEPMAATRGAEAMGDAYFGFYLWAMGSGRPRSPKEIRAMLHAAGFADTRRIATHQPLITSLIVARA
ncbi:MAG: methyltransferase [Erythrobacter sp.]|nr:methyltransferase [Erythrobacter sp.]NCQ64857.1 methyltransferase [Alphaproteobacteria bacterium]